MPIILKIILCAITFLPALFIGWIALALGLTGGLPEDVSPIAMANVLVIAALLTAALNVGWIVAYKRK